LNHSMRMNHDRTSRLAHRLLESGREVVSFHRESVFYDVKERKKYPYSKRGLALEKYANRADIFGSFTNLPKLGINPSTTYETPIGVYGYPMMYIVENYSESSGKFEVPFAGDAEYLHIFTVKDMDQALEFNPDETAVIGQVQNATEEFPVSEDQKSEIYKALWRSRSYIYEQMKKLNYDQFPPKLKEGWQLKGASIDNYEPAFEDVMLEYFKDNPIRDYMSLAIGGVLEGAHTDGLFTIIMKDMSLRSAAEQVRFPYEGWLKDLPDIKALGEDGYLEQKRKTLEEGQRVACDTAYVWNFLRLFTSNKVKWTSMLRQMGFIGAIDNGTSTIHPNEPNQAVIFNPSSIKVIEVMHKKIPQQHTGKGSTYQSLFGQWSEAPEKNVKSVLALLDREVRDLKVKYNATTGRYIDPDLTYTLKYIGWLNTHAMENPEWSAAKKREIETGLKRAMTSELSAPGRGMFERVFRSLRGR